MAELLFRLNNVPEDEAIEVRTVLDEGQIDYYETTAGNWGVSLAAIWLRDDSQLVRAQAIVDQYQQQRATEMREQALQNPPESLSQRLLRSPLQALAYLVVIAAILYISIVPFLTAWDA